MKIYLKIFFKGFAMGIAEIIPGISGGTVALILGIYQRLINSISEINVDFFTKLRSRKFKDAVEQIDLNFLLTMALGMICAIFLLSNLIIYLLSFYPVFFKSSLSALLFFSLFIKPLKPKRIDRNLLYGLSISAVVAIILFATPSLDPSEVNLFYLFVSGCIALCALVLPGISGSFILLLLGVYTTVVDALRNFEITILSVFILGCAFGLFSSVRIIRRLYEKKEELVLSTFFGLILFSIPIIWKEDVFVLNLPKFSNDPFSVLGGLLMGFILIYVLDKNRE
jgi:putative membrane protein